jgi:GntR family transcriptional regulator / MocR family aminotransferase
MPRPYDTPTSCTILTPPSTLYPPPPAMDLLIQLDRSAPLSLHQQLYEAIRQAILEGQLLPGQRLPSTRSLAHSLSVSRTTVTQSYEQLLSQGYLETMHGSGTYVCAQLPDFLGRSGPVNTAPPERSPVSLSPYGTRLQQTALIQQPEPATPISFRYGRPALDRFPLKLWPAIFRAICRCDRPLPAIWHGCGQCAVIRHKLS